MCIRDSRSTAKACRYRSAGHSASRCPNYRAHIPEADWATVDRWQEQRQPAVPTILLVGRGSSIGP
eukprot:4546553-Alexandrium_andersonii.AAC.1